MYVVEPMPQALPAELLERLAQVDTATIGHMRHHGFMRPSVTPVLGAVRAAGTAVTVSTPGPDSTILHHAMGLLRRGDFLVIERCGDRIHACWGGILAHAAQRIGLAGVVVDGPVTDPDELRAIGVPVWSRGISPVTTKAVAMGGHVNVPVSCGGVAVLPGDAILADASGVLVLRAAEAADLATRALERQAREPGIVQRILQGESVAELSGAAARFAQANSAAPRH